jgi:uncharacterized protein involved in type VI secretion and phage assembly
MAEASDHKPPVTVKANGADVDVTVVERIEVRTYTGLPDMATLRMADPEGEDAGKPKFKIGDTIEIRFGESTAMTAEPVFRGEIVASEYEFDVSTAIISFRAYDSSHRLQRNRRTAIFQKMTTSDIVQKVAGQLGLQVGRVEPTRTVHPFVQQSMETDLDFLRRLAAMDNCEFGVQDGKVQLVARRNGAGATPTFAWRENAKSFKPRMTAAQQHDSVTVRSYDPKTKQAFTATVKQPTAVVGPAQQARTDGKKSFGAAELLIADRIVGSQAEAQALAQSTLDSLAGGSFEAEGVMEGDPRVKAGGMIAVKGFGKQFEGEYVVTSATHVYTAGDYRTKFAISGRNPRTLTDVMRPKSDREWGTNGIVIGLVTNIDDTKDSEAGGSRQGKVRVKYPSLGDSAEGAWARVAYPSAGKGRGMMFMPEIGDEVVVAFEHGDTRRPVVIGSLFNAKDVPTAKMLGDKPRGGAFVLHTPQDADVKVDKKLMIAAKDQVEIAVEGGNEEKGKFTLKPKDAVEIAGGTTIKFQGNGKIEILSNADITIDGKGQVNVKGTGGVTVEATANLKLKGAMIDIEGTGAVQIKGATINIG